MAYDEHRLKPVIDDFSGGLVTLFEPEKLNPNQSPNAQNIDFIGRNSFTTREGFALIGNRVTEAGKIRSLFNFKKTDGTETLVRSRGTTLEHLLDGVWTAIEGIPTYAADKEFGFAIDTNLMYFGNGVEAYSRWSGSGNITQYASNPKGNILFIFEKRMWVAGDPANPNLVSYSKTGNMIDFTFSTPRLPDDGGSLTIGDGGDAIVALASREVGGGEKALIVFKKSSAIYAVTLDATTGLPKIQELKRGIGAQTHRSTFAAENDVIHIDQHNHIRALGFFPNIADIQTESFSKVLSPTMTQLRFDKAAGIYSNRRVYIACRTAVADENNRLFVYDFNYGGWMKWVGINATQFAIYEGKIVFAASDQQNVFKLGSSSDDGGPIAVLFDTKDINYDAPHLFKQERFVDIRGFISSGALVTVELIYEADEEQKVVFRFSAEDGITEGSAGSQFAVSKHTVGYYTLLGGSAIGEGEITMRRFYARLSLPEYAHVTLRVRIQVSGIGTPIIITHIIPWGVYEPEEKFPESNKI